MLTNSRAPSSPRVHCKSGSAFTTCKCVLLDIHISAASPLEDSLTELLISKLNITYHYGEGIPGISLKYFSTNLAMLDWFQLCCGWVVVAVTGTPLLYAGVSLHTIPPIYQSVADPMQEQTTPG